MEVACHFANEVSKILKSMRGDNWERVIRLVALLKKTITHFMEDPPYFETLPSLPEHNQLEGFAEELKTPED